VNITLIRDSGFEIFGTIYLLLFLGIVITKQLWINKEIYLNSGQGLSTARRNFFKFLVGINSAKRIESEKGNKLHKHKNNL
jgi:hypothetical protein